MFEVTENEILSLDSFALKWRWTDTRWNKLPDHALQTIRPLTVAKARALHRYSCQFVDQAGVLAAPFASLAQVSATVEAEQIRHWLADCVPDAQQTVLVSWDDRCAVLVQWRVFCEFWDDFCYPSSDDVTIFPFDEKWLLFYSHDEYFVFGKNETLGVAL